MSSHEQTDIAMADPKPGMRFHEMFAFWVYVVQREGDLVWWVESPDFICEPVESDDKFWVTKRITGFKNHHKGTVQEFQKRHGFKPGRYCSVLIAKGRIDDDSLALMQQWLIEEVSE